MWRLTMRGERGSAWVEVGSFESIASAALRIIKLESKPSQPAGSIFFRVYADPLMEKSDAEILSRLEYQSPTNFYLLERQAN